MKKGLNNPAVIGAAVASPEGRKALSKTLETADKNVNATVNIFKGVLIITALGGATYLGYKAITDGFTPLSEDSNYMPSNVSTGVAKAKAEAIYKAMYGAGSGFTMVKAILQYVNGERINHNGFIRVINAFGKRRGQIPFSKKMTLVEWFTDQFDESELLELRLIIKNFF